MTQEDLQSAAEFDRVARQLVDGITDDMSAQDRALKYAEACDMLAKMTEEPVDRD